MDTPDRVDFIIQGRRISVDVVGAGVPCVLLHPFPFDRRYFSATASQIGHRARTIVPDLRGFGASELGGDFSIADLADDVAAVLDQMRIDKAVLLGMSMGGYVALAFAARHPRRLLALALCDTRAGADSDEARANRDKDMALVLSAGTAAFVDRQLPRLLSAAAPETLRKEVKAMADQKPASVLAALRALRDRPDRRAELANIACPTLVVVGMDDVLTPPAEAAALTTAIPRAVLMELPGAGHLANLEAPAPFAQAIIGFLGRAQSAVSAPKT